MNQFKDLMRKCDVIETQLRKDIAEVNATAAELVRLYAALATETYRRDLLAGKQPRGKKHLRVV